MTEEGNAENSILTGFKIFPYQTDRAIKSIITQYMHSIKNLSLHIIIVQMTSGKLLQ
jgi:hypothetical protein